MANSVVGLGLASPPVQLSNTVNAISQKFIVPVLGDNVFKPSPVFWALTREGKRFGAGELIFPEIYQEELPGGAYFGDQLLDTSVVDSVQPANQQWKPYRQPVVIPITDIILNRGGSNNLDIIRAKFQTASGSFLQKLSRALWHTSPQNTSLDVDDLNSWVVSTTNTIAGINRSTAGNTFWQPNANVSVGTAGTVAEDDVENAYQQITYGWDEPDLMLMTPTMYRSFKKAYTTQIRYNQPDQDEQAVQFGFRYHLKYNNMVVFQDRFLALSTLASNSHQYSLLMNTKYVWPVFHPANYFDVDPFIRPSNQKVLVAQVTLTWQLSCVSPRMNAALDFGQ
jgi:hypothetical protein